jgi:NAD(P)H-flavin reductase
MMHKTLNRNFEIKGPFGKGLNIRKGVNGVHIAFAAGTGILPFMDLVAYLARK